MTAKGMQAPVVRTAMRARTHRIVSKHDRLAVDALIRNEESPGRSAWAFLIPSGAGERT